MNALKQRAQSALNDESLDPQSRATLRHALEQNDPWLAEVVRRDEAGESISKGDSREKIEALAGIICGAGNESAAALFVLMGTMQNSNEPEALANTVKHFAFTRCGELNIFGMVDAQIAVVEGELLAGAVTS
ncbi:MAG TPA: hypothetical protein VKB05_18780 [Pyrinomonadaceae bacterium]|nr:hypothetical protein [Pyrinomonadaceae bacterium]